MSLKRGLAGINFPGGYQRALNLSDESAEGYDRTGDLEKR